MLIVLHSAIGRMRLMSSREVIVAAENLARLILETYASPNRTFEQLRESMVIDQSAPLEAFGEACRTELVQLQA